MRNNLGESCRGLDFDFGDCDSLLVELEEQYRNHFSTFQPKFKISKIFNYSNWQRVKSYAESNDLNLNRLAAFELADESGFDIGSEPFCRRALDNLDINNDQTRLSAVRARVSYLLFRINPYEVAYFEKKNQFFRFSKTICSVTCSWKFLKMARQSI